MYDFAFTYSSVKTQLVNRNVSSDAFIVGGIQENGATLGQVGMAPPEMVIGTGLSLANDAMLAYDLTKLARWGASAALSRVNTAAWQARLNSLAERLPRLKWSANPGMNIGNLKFRGPQGPRSPLGSDVVESFPDPDPTVYGNGLRPDTPVVDHLRARALRGHPTDPDNLHIKAWSENSRKGWHEGNYLREKARLLKGGLTPRQAEWVLEDYLRWIETDIHATPVDPTKLNKLRSP
jgi:hypothetical protein